MNIPRTIHNIDHTELANIIDSPEPFIIEIGCNNGRDTKAFLDTTPTATIHCFEPDPRAISDFGLYQDQRVTLHRCAIGNRSENVFLYQSGGIPDCDNPNQEWHKSSSILPPTGHYQKSPEITFTKRNQVCVRTLDSFLDEFPSKIDLIWMDVQGAEALVILGAQRTFERTHYIYTEYYDSEMYLRQPDLKAILAFMPEWEPMKIYGENVLLRNTKTDV
jgi:FkbM family methyltransferase